MGELTREACAGSGFRIEIDPESRSECRSARGAGPNALLGDAGLAASGVLPEPWHEAQDEHAAGLPPDRDWQAASAGTTGHAMPIREGSAWRTATNLYGVAG